MVVILLVGKQRRPGGGWPLLVRVGHSYVPPARANVTAAVVLRWAIQQDIVAVPKSASARRQRSNLDVFSFQLTPEQMDALATLDLGESAAVDSDQREEF